MPFRNLPKDIKAKISLFAYKVEDEARSDIYSKCVDVENTSNVKTSKIESDN